MSFVSVSFDKQIASQSIRVSVVGFILAFYVVYRSGAIDVMVKLFVHFVVKIFNINVHNWTFCLGSMGQSIGHCQ